MQEIKLLEYGRSPLNASDHKPVFALFDCCFKRVAEKKEKQVRFHKVSFHMIVLTVKVSLWIACPDLRRADLPTDELQARVATHAAAGN